MNYDLDDTLGDKIPFEIHTLYKERHIVKNHNPIYLTTTL